MPGKTWTRELYDRDGTPLGRWQATAWVRDRDGRRRCVRARGGTPAAAESALERRLDARTGRGGSAAVGVTPEMTLADLAALWIEHRVSEAAAPVAGQPRGAQGGPVSPQTLAGYQAAITQVIVPLLCGLRVEEAPVGILDETLRAFAASGRATGMVHTVLKQMFALAVRHDALTSNPMREVTRPRRPRSPVRRLTVDQARALVRYADSYTDGHAVDEFGRRTGGRRRSPVLHDMIVFLLATGCRIGEGLAITWRDLDLTSDPPTVTIGATLVEPRKQATPTGRGSDPESAPARRVFVERLHRQPITKGGGERTLALPDAAVMMLNRRRRTRATRALDAPVFTSATGGWLSPANQRTKLRTMLNGTELQGLSPHVLRRTVGTHLAHEAGIETAREVLGHADTSVTWRHYVAARTIAPDVRDLLDQFFDDVPGDRT
ncbi:MAG: tyrosine-type recombinase/integrase [Nocardioides sp.]|uniref:tyrosine-type recombinase/integrase n=1 Tax=Nocardioides sp. TaxID=35761 RepID=UPI00239BD134|nr:tyrosine-type recombinase/integrase [Nocardioides sp.]MDE0775440.1 tyrosine-type recombinase/integrase [Nocardioides sp.]